MLQAFRRTSDSVPKILVLLIADAITPCSTTLALAQKATGAELEQLRRDAHRAAQQYIDTVRPRLFSDLSASEERVYREISFVISDDDIAWETSGSLSSDGERSVTIDIGYVRKLEMFAEAERLEQKTGHDVLVPYISYVAHSLNSGQSYIKSPALFIGMSMNQVDQLDAPSPEKQNEMAMVVNSIAFILAHEVGHHILGHYDRPPASPERSREMETEADAWALKQCANGHFSPLGGMLPVIFEYYTTANPIQSEQQNHHPADMRRLRATFAAMLDSLPAFKTEIESHGVSYSDFRRSIKKQLDEYDWQITSGSSVAYDSTTSAYDVCMQRRIKLCMDDCIHNYNFSVKECGNKLCNPDKGTNINWAAHCRAITK
jgi:hypothetical protein